MVLGSSIVSHNKEAEVSTVPSPAAKDRLIDNIVNASANVVVVLVALIVLAVMSAFLVKEVGGDDAKLAIGTTALGVISAIVGAFFGVKSATESREDAQKQTKELFSDATKELKEAHGKLVAAAHAADPNDPQMKDALGIE
jgi:hypothetical protein